MRRVLVCVLALCACAVAAANDPFGEDWPEGPNRELAGAFCGACHSLAIVRQQGLDRKGWDKLLTWMSETQNMPVVDAALRSMLLDYLETSFGPDGKTVDSVAAGLLVESDGGLQGVNLTPLIPAQ